MINRKITIKKNNIKSFYKVLFIYNSFIYKFVNFKLINKTKAKYEQLEIEISKQAVKHQMIKDYINTLKKQEKLLTKFDGLVWGSLLESATIKDKDVIVFRFKDGTEING